VTDPDRDAFYDELRQMYPEEALRLIHESDMEADDKCDSALTVLKFADPVRSPDLFLGLRETIFADPEARTHMIIRAFTIRLNDHTGLLSDRLFVEAAAEMTAMAATMLEPISDEATEEIDLWKHVFEQIADRLPARKSYQCAHCGVRRDDMFAVMDEWVLCLSASDGGLSCYTRVHDKGEPLGSGRESGQN